MGSLEDYAMEWVVLAGGGRVRVEVGWKSEAMGPKKLYRSMVDGRRR